jgi:hypothetical protein
MARREIEMDRHYGTLVTFGIVSAFVIGLFITDAFADHGALDAAQARAAQARASAAEAVAAQAWVEARAAEQSQEQMAQAARIRVLGLNIAAAVACVGLALALVTWANVRARVVYPNASGQYGLLVDRRRNGELWVLDPARMLGPALIVEDANLAVHAPLSAPVEAHLQLATQAQAAGVMTGLAAVSDPAVNMAERMKSAAQALPAPTFAQTGDMPRFIFVSDPSRHAQAKRDQALREVDEFIRRGWVTGISRDRWMGETFGTGRQCTKGYWGTLIEQLERAHVIAPTPQGGHAPAVPLQEALAAFGLEEQKSKPDADEAGQHHPEPYPDWRETDQHSAHGQRGGRQLSPSA